MVTGASNASRGVRRASGSDEAVNRRMERAEDLTTMVSSSSPVGASRSSGSVVESAPSATGERSHDQYQM